MQSRGMGVALAVVALAVAAALFVILRDDGSDPTPAPPPAGQEEAREPEPGGPGQETGAEGQEAESERQEPDVPIVVLRDGEPVGGAQELSFRRGERIAFVVRSNTDEEVHLHGYDVVHEIEAGGRARFDVEAEFEGVFEVETHPGHVVVAEVLVGP